MWDALVLSRTSVIRSLDVGSSSSILHRLSTAAARRRYGTDLRGSAASDGQGERNSTVSIRLHQSNQIASVIIAHGRTPSPALGNRVTGGYGRQSVLESASSSLRLLLGLKPVRRPIRQVRWCSYPKVSMPFVRTPSDPDRSVHPD